MERRPESVARRRSLVILMRAVSVLWRGRKPDWNCSYRSLEVRWEWSCEATVFSKTFEINGRFEIGRRLLKLLGSEPDFFSIGVMAAVLNAVGKIPVESDE